MLESVILEPNPNKANASVIWLHGLGADGNDFAPIAQQFSKTNQAHSVRYIFPHAPSRPVTINAGMVMPAWFDITALAWDAPWDLDGIQSATNAILALVKHEIAQGIPENRIILAGFSQGGAVALFTALSSGLNIAGTIALSTFLPNNDNLRKKYFNNKEIRFPIFLAHGDADPLIDYALAIKTLTSLKEMNCHIDWHAYAGLEHSVNSQEIADIDEWLLKSMANV